MDFLSQAKEVGIAIFSVAGAGYLIKIGVNKISEVTNMTITANKEVFNALMKQMNENQADYRSYVEENNHQKTEFLQEGIKTMAEVRQSISENTKAVEKMNDILLKVVTDKKL